MKRIHTFKIDPIHRIFIYNTKSKGKYSLFATLVKGSAEKSPLYGRK